VAATAGSLRIGELGRRSGVSPNLLRAWERRYGLLRPVRSPGGLRLYSSEDLARVQAMRQHLASGLAAAEAAALALRTDQAAGEPDLAPEAAQDEFEAAFSAFDEAAAHAVVDSLLASLTLDTFLGKVVVPYLHALGERWERGEASIAQEHFASNVLRGRLLGLARGWGRGLGPSVVLACPPGEHHDLGLLAFGLALHARGWRIVYLGANTPLTSIADTADALRPTCVVVSAVSSRTFRDHRDELTELAAAHRLYLGGAGAEDATLDAELARLTGGPVEEAERLTRMRDAAT
jgi:DNA-binding transcriptional MerR regulator